LQMRRHAALLLRLAEAVGGHRSRSARSFREPSRSSVFDMVPKVHAAAQHRHISAENYLCFLRVCRDMFAVLTLLSAFMTSPLWGFGPLLAGFLGGESSLTAPLSEGSSDELALPMVKTLYSTTVLYSIVFMFFALRFSQECEERGSAVADTPAKRKMRRTIWLQRLPLSDGVWGAKEFEYTDEDLDRVTQDLRVEVLKFLQEKKKSDLWLEATKLKLFRERKASVTSEAAPKDGQPRKDRSKSWHLAGPRKDRQSAEETEAPPEEVAAPQPCGSASPVESEAGFSERSAACAFGCPTYKLLSRAGSLMVMGRRCKSPIVNIDIAPNVEELSNVSIARRDCEELADMYSELCERYSSTRGPGLPVFRWLYRKWYGRRHRLVYERMEELRSRQLYIELQRKRLSGSAFITFASQGECSLMLNKVPPWWDCNQWFFRSKFSFGRPPFAAVTLFCYRAPHPDDINWQNLHTKSYSRRIRYWLLTLVVCVLAVSLSAGVDRLKQQIAWVSEHAPGEESPMTMRFVAALPPVLLLGINNVVLPYSIQYVASAERNRQKSHEQLRQLYINFYFLMLTSLAVPFFGFSTLYQLVDVLHTYLPRKRFDRLSEHIARELLDLSGDFTLRYVTTALFLSNPFVLLKAPLYNLCLLLRSKVMALPLREQAACRRPMQFSWGFWYAWVLIIGATGTIYGVVLPGIYPLMTLFFATRHLIERYAFRHGLTDAGPDAEGTYAAIVLYQWFIVGVMWLCMMGIFFLSICRQRSDCPAWLSPWGCGILTMSPVVLLPIFWLRKRHAMLGLTASERYSGSAAEDVNGLDEEEEEDDEQKSMNWKASQAVERDPLIDSIVTMLRRRGPKMREQVLYELKAGKSVPHLWEMLQRAADLEADRMQHDDG